MTDRSVVAACLLGVSRLRTGLSGSAAVRRLRARGLPSASAVSDRPRHCGSGRGTGPAYAFAAAGAGIQQADDAAPPDVGLPWA